jgi:trimethylamine--corrinoid protein Co-methyltransferase
VLDDDIAGMVGRYLEGMSVTDETLALDLIEQVGPIPGHFLGLAHTRKWWKQEQYIPKSSDTQTYPEWLQGGKKSCVDYARERMEDIIASHKPMPLTDRQEDDLERILEDARAHYERAGHISPAEMKAYRAVLRDCA